MQFSSAGANSLSPNMKFVVSINSLLYKNVKGKDFYQIILDQLTQNNTPDDLKEIEKVILEHTNNVNDIIFMEETPPDISKLSRALQSALKELKFWPLFNDHTPQLDKSVLDKLEQSIGGGINQGLLCKIDVLENQKWVESTKQLGGKYERSV